MRDIGKNIKALRERKCLTQDQLAEQLFVTRQTVSNYETGRSRPDVEMLTKIAEVLEVDANSVIYGVEPTPEQRLERRSLVIAFALTLAITILNNLTAAKHRLIIRGLFQLCSRLIDQSRYTDTVDELLINLQSR